MINLAPYSVRRKLSRLSCLAYALLLCINLCLCQCISVQIPHALSKEDVVLKALTPKLDKLPPRKMLHGNVGQDNVLVAPPHPSNILGFSQEATDYPKRVDYVRPNSLAWRQGLMVNDLILNEGSHPPYAALVIQRGKKKYSLILDTRQLAPRPQLASGAEIDASKNLAKRSIVVMVDDSASMQTKDCPGNQSRWQWCRDHISGLYIAGGGMLEHNISIVTFDSAYHSFRNSSSSKLSEIFQSIKPEGETFMAPALSEAFNLVNSTLQRGQPALVALISDGRPTDADKVKKTIIEEINHLSHPELLCIEFIEVGTPDAYLRELDSELVRQGAAKDIVTVVPFGGVSSQPLSVTLSSALPKDDKLNAGLKGGVTSSNGAAQSSHDAHIITQDSHQASAAPPVVPKVITAQPPVKAQPPVRPAPPIKAHPSGTSATTVTAPVKPVEVDEKESVLKHNANRTY